MSDYAGRRLGPYRIITKLGAGGMATVYKAFDPRMGRYVAIKLLPPQFATQEKLRARFEQEARVAANLEHHNILPVYDFGEQDGLPYLVMRLLSNGSLADRIRYQGIVSPDETVRLTRQIAAGLDYAHASGVIHRDLKPANVMLDNQSNAYLADFGLAQLAEDSLSLTGGRYIGTPIYSSPEQCMGNDLTPASDIYSLGIMLFQMLTGNVPFTGPSTPNVLHKHISDPLPDPRQYNAKLSRHITTVLRKATAKDPRSRFANGDELVNALDEAIQRAAREEASSIPYVQPGEHANTQTQVDLRHLAVPTPTPAPFARPVLTAPEPEPETESIPDAPVVNAAWRSRTFWMVAVGVLVAIVVVAAAAFVLSAGSPGDPAAAEDAKVSPTATPDVGIGGPDDVLADYLSPDSRALSIRADCESTGQGSLQIASDAIIYIRWGWIADYREQIDIHTAHVNYQITINGVDTGDWRTAEVQDTIANGRPARYWYFYLGELPAGTYRIDFSAVWDAHVTDGIRDFGPGTANETIQSGCTFTVTE
jgi:serine/threonine-protein kinase